MEIHPQIIAALITSIVGGGIITLITGIAKGLRSWRQGARQSTRDVIRDLAAARDESEIREETVRRDMEYWRDVAGQYGFQLRQVGVIPDPLVPRPPSDRQRTVTTLQGQRAARAPTTEEIERQAEEDGEIP